MKPSERYLLLSCYQARLTYRQLDVEHSFRVRDICHAIGNYKQNLYYLEKWTRKGWYSYGVTLDLGWLTDEGERVAREQVRSEASEVARETINL